MTEQSIGTDAPERVSNTSNDPDDYDTSAAPNPDIDAVGAETDMGTGQDEEREIGGRAEVEPPLP
jgi:hypothetical protein